MNAAFASALLRPDAALPEGLIDHQGRPAPRRFDVYRNNVALGLIRVLQAGFPATQQLVGEAFFTAMAGEFIRARPPKTRMMMLYGAEFAEFIAQFPPASALPYLPDVARLEQALREAYHSADTVPIDAGIFAKMSEPQLLALRFTFAPALRAVSSPWPIYGIWAANMRGGPKPVMRGEDVVVLRPAFDPMAEVLPQNSWPILGALMAGASLKDALAAASGEIDLAALLTLLLSGGAIIKVQ